MIKYLNDILIFVGDYIDRGKQSYDVVQKIKELVFQGAVALRGNHEEMAIKVIDGTGSSNNANVWFYNGGQETLDSYKENKASITDELEFLKSLPIVYEADNYIFVHAGLQPGTPLYLQDSSDMLWIRDEFINSNENWGKTVIYGHTPMKEISYGFKKIGIDTGCVFNGKLSCIELPSGKVYHT